MTHKPVGIANPAVAVAIRQAGDACEVRRAFKGSQHFPKRDVAFTADDDIDTKRRILVDIRRKTRVVTADDDKHAGSNRADEGDDFLRRHALKRHHGEPDDVRLVRLDEAHDRLGHRRLHEHEIGDGDVVVGVDVTGERCQRVVGHTHRQRRRMLERVGHREQQEVHRFRSTVRKAPSISPRIAGSSMVDGTAYGSWSAILRST
jgi:hypothetical protein